jgi:hypothetical protein
VGPILSRPDACSGLGRVPVQGVRGRCPRGPRRTLSGSLTLFWRRAPEWGRPPAPPHSCAPVCCHSGSGRARRGERIRFRASRARQREGHTERKKTMLGRSPAGERRACFVGGTRYVRGPLSILNTGSPGMPRGLREVPTAAPLHGGRWQNGGRDCATVSGLPRRSTACKGLVFE